MPSCRPVLLPLLFLAACSDASNTGQSDAAVPRWHGSIDSILTTAMVDTMPSSLSDSMNQPYGPRELAADEPGGGWARAVSSRYFVRWSVNGDSNSIRTIRRDLIGPALSVRERQEADSSLVELARRLGQPVSGLPFGVPGSKTPISGLMFDRQGRLWVQLNVGDGENNRADVWDSTGKRVANAEWPDGIDLRHGQIDERTAFGVRKDSAGARQVVRIRFR